MREEQKKKTKMNKRKRLNPLFRVSLLFVSFFQYSNICRKIVSDICEFLERIEHNKN